MQEKSGKAKTGSTSNLMSCALDLYKQGDIGGAKRIFQKVMKKDPCSTDALYNLGLIAKDQVRINDAVECYEKVLNIDPSYVNAYFNLGGIFIDQGKYDEAYEQFQKVVSLSPDYTNAWYNLGFIEAVRGRQQEAVRLYEKALSINPEFANAWYNIGWILLDQKKFDQAVRYFEKVLSLNPGHPDALFNLGYISMEKKDNNKAKEYYEAVVKTNPDYFLAYNNLGLISQMEHQLDRATEYYEKALSINPQFSDAYLNMGNLFRAKGDNNKALEYYKKSVDLKPSLVGLLNLFGLQKEMCLYKEASELTAKALEYEELKKSDLASIHDTFIQTCEWEKAGSIIKRFREADMDPAGKDVLAGSFMEFCAITDLSLDEISEQHKTWGNLTEQERTPFEHGRVFKDQKRKKIRIGYSSPDLREHSVGYLIKDIIKSHNHDEFEVYCYANFNANEMDSFTQEMINASNLFKYVKHLSEKELAEEIYRDEIDILIDLAGHTAGHRLRSFAYKPAPIQITYLGYPNTTGLSRIDYRLTDRFAESGEENDYRYSEKLIRLTNCFLSFQGFGDVVPAEIKENRGEKIIFGCFNNIQKLTAKAIELWSRILKAFANSELHLKAKQLNTPFIWDNIVREFAKHDITEERIKCLGYTATREEHLRLYNSIDISLDTFPYNGTVTTLEALWMNMPVITLVGESHAQRVGYS
ncbi:MAG: tetratricopeptide repeat protein, partial [Deltaproteobacteria bacterium]|nr:tetratricopeptide repeat protein [Deltaproteobacteria bacterium]